MRRRRKQTLDGEPEAIKNDKGKDLIT